MSWLDPLLAIKTQQAGTTAGTRQTINFASGATVVDDPANDRVNVTISATPADASTTVKGIVQLAGDIAGTATSVTVAKVNGVSVSGTPTSGQVIRATSGTASSWANVARGDIANTSGAAGDLITGDATTLGRLGIGSAGQVLTVSGGVPVWATPSAGGGTYPPVDANHTHVWHAAATDGASIVADVGGVNLTGATGLAAQTGYCYRSKNSIVNTGTATQTLNTPAVISFGTATFEMVVYMGAQVIDSLSTNSPAIVLGASSPPYNTAEWHYKGSASNCRATFYAGSFLLNAYQNWGNGTGTGTGGATGALVELNQVHHVMFAWTNGGGYAWYLDGELFGTPGSAGSVVLSAALYVLIPIGMSVADIRISNIARDQAYARAAYRALKAI